ncbi:MAG: MinD/ParA family protein [Bacillota bacterium]
MMGLQNLQQKNTTQQAEQDNTRVISIASGKGGVGKTNLSVNLGINLYKEGVKTLLIDADFGMANVDILLGITPQYNLSHILNGKCMLPDAIITGPGSLDILPGNSGVDNLINMSSVAIKRLLETSSHIEEVYDMVIVDVGAGINRDVTNFIQASDEAIIVLTPEPTAIMDAYSLTKFLQGNEYSGKINLVLNQIDSREEGEKVSRRIHNAVKKYLQLEIETIGYIPYDDKVRKAVKSQIPFTLKSPNSQASRAIERITDTLLERKREEKSRGMKGFVFKMVGMFNSVFGKD